MDSTAAETGFIQQYSTIKEVRVSQRIDVSVIRGKCGDIAGEIQPLFSLP